MKTHLNSESFSQYNFSLLDYSNLPCIHIFLQTDRPSHSNLKNSYLGPRFCNKKSRILQVSKFYNCQTFQSFHPTVIIFHHNFRKFGLTYQFFPQKLKNYDQFKT